MSPFVHLFAHYEGRSVLRAVIRCCLSSDKIERLPIQEISALENSVAIDSAGVVADTEVFSLGRMVVPVSSTCNAL